VGFGRRYTLGKALGRKNICVWFEGLF